MLTAMVLAVVAFASMSATAAADEPFEIRDAWDERCPAVTENDNEVSGGCLIEDFEGELQLHHLGSTIGDYPVDFDLVLDGDGQGYAVDPMVGQSNGFQRKACDEADGTPKPWAVQVRQPAWGDIEIDIVVGMTIITNPPGSSCTQQQITVEMDPYYGTTLTQIGSSTNIRNAWWHTDNNFYYAELWD